MFVDENLDNDKYLTVAYQRYLKKFLRCVKGVDDNVGRLLAHLEKTGELRRTIATGCTWLTMTIRPTLACVPRTSN